MVDISNLTFSYGNKTVLDKINLKLEPGRTYGLLGENGVGKTTLLTLLCGLKKPEGGSIDIDGYAPYDRQPSFLSSIVYLPDEVMPLREKAHDWAKARGKFWPSFDYDKFCDIMKEFENGDQMLSSMSAGQLKKTYISFAIACNTGYAFMDEPTNGLDIPGKAQFRSVITKYTDERSTIVISTHQVRDLENIIDPIVILDSNAVLLSAGLDEIASRLYFDYGTELNPGSLYTEQLPGGFIQVYPNVTGQESKVNIEALFNTTHLHKELIKNIFAK